MKTIGMILFLTSVALIGKCQAVGARITETSIGLYNQSNKTITFLLGLQASALDTFQIYAERVWHSREYPQGPIIKIVSDKDAVTYKLKLGKYYKIFWNERKRYWDVHKIKRESDVPR